MKKGFHELSKCRSTFCLKVIVMWPWPFCRIIKSVGPSSSSIQNLWYFSFGLVVSGFQYSRCSFSTMVMLMMVKWVYDHSLISPSLTSILPYLAWSKPSLAHLTIIEKLHRLQLGHENWARIHITILFLLIYIAPFLLILILFSKSLNQF